jgi:hypothetical protein
MHSSPYTDKNPTFCDTHVCIHYAPWDINECIRCAPYHVLFCVLCALSNQSILFNDVCELLLLYRIFKHGI